MLRPCSAKTRRTASSVPGSLRTATTSVVRVAVRPPRRGSDGASGRARTRNRVRLPGRSPISSARISSPNRRGGPRREHGRRAALAAVDDRLAGAGRVVGRQQLPRAAAQEAPRPGRAPGCASRRARSHRRRWPGSAARQRRTGTTTSPRICEVVLEQQVVVLADGAVDDVLDRDDAGQRRRRRPRSRRPRGSCRARRGRRRRTPRAPHPRRRRRARRRRRPAMSSRHPWSRPYDTVRAW